MSNPIRMAVHYLGNLMRFAWTSYLRASGITIGQRTMISLGAKLDLRRGKIVIGNDCLITSGCKILSHDGASRMIDPLDDGLGKVIIGDNVFIGVNTIVLRNVTIGSNTVIGAGSIVTKDIPSGVLAAGIPARVLKELPQPYPVLTRPHKKDHR